jgi:hypothetical protein
MVAVEPPSDDDYLPWRYLQFPEAITKEALRGIIAGAYRRSHAKNRGITQSPFEAPQHEVEP